LHNKLPPFVVFHVTESWKFRPMLGSLAAASVWVMKRSVPVTYLCAVIARLDRAIQ